MSEYRGIGFSITPLGDYHWRWVLQPQNETAPGTANPIDFGDLFGTHGEAVAAVKKAIDEKLAGDAAP